MNDFLTDDFVNKNIRVRPNSGKSQEGTKEMQSYGSKAVIGDTGKDETEEQIIHLELDEQRSKVKNMAKQKEEERVKRLKALEKDGKK
jgi:hypothetical protein